MAKPTTVRIPEDILKEIDQQAKKLKLDRSTYLREVLTKGLSMDKKERTLKEYSRGELTMIEACHKLKYNPWEFFSLLQSVNLHLNVTLEDWIDSEHVENLP